MNEVNNIWIVKADYIKEYEIELEFNNGVSGMVDLKDDLDLPVFEPLKDISYFKNFKLNSWTIEWENGADFAPEFLYDKVKQHSILALS